MPRLLLALATVVAATAVAVPLAQADPPWSAPAPLAGSAGAGTPVAFTSAGRAVALTPADRSAGAGSQLVPLAADGTPGTPQHLALAAGLLATFAHDSVVVTGSSMTSSGSVGPHSTTLVASGTPDGVGTPRALPGTTDQRPAALAADARGDVALVTLGAAGRARDRVVWLRRAGGAFRAVLRIHVTERARGATVAVGPTGDVLVVYEDRHHVYARHRGASGRWGAAHVLGAGVQSALQAAI